MRAFIKNYIQAERERREENGEKGFSLIELIVVVAILGILVAIAIPVFNGLQERATRNSAESAAANAATQVASQIASGETATVPASTAEFSFSFVGGTPSTVDSVCIRVAAVGDDELPSGGRYDKGPGCTGGGEEEEG